MEKVVEKETVRVEVLDNTALAEEKVQKSLNYDLLLPEEKERVDELVTNFNVKTANDVIQFASNIQEKMAVFSNTVLDNVKTKDSGEVGDILSGLVAQINDFDAIATGENQNIFEKIFKKGRNSVEKIVAKYSKVETNVDRIVNTLEKNKITMMKDIAIYENMYNENVEFFKELSLYIIAADKKLKMLNEEELPKLKKIAEESKEEMDIQKVNDLTNMITKLEKKVHDLKITRTISIQMAPQIRMLQNNEMELTEKIQSAIVNTLPLWKSQMLLALGVANAKTAYNAQDALSNATNELLKKNSELLKQGSIDIAKASERAVVDVETLKITNRNIIDTIEEVINIHNEGKKTRELAEQEIIEVENDMKECINKVR
jgi:uncharacterized protein YaaN involved in tellurite resistance